MTYAKARLTLGICYVGLTVVAATVLLSLNMPQKLLSSYPEPAYLSFKYIFAAVFIFEALTLPFDLAGYLIDKRYERCKVSLPSYIKEWLFASFNHALILIGFATFTLFAAKLGGIFALVLIMVLMSLFLIWKQAIIASFLSGMRFEEPPQQIKAEFPQNRKGKIPLISAICKDLNFTGGIVGLPGKETLIMPKEWLEKFTMDELFAELTRRNQVIRSGARARGVYVAVLFNTLGIIVSALLTTNLSNLQLDCSSGIITLSLYFTLWSFMGLLILPKFSHEGVFEADYLALQKGIKPQLLESTIKTVDSYLEDEYERAKGRDVVFHPIPSTSRRISRIRLNTAPSKGAWNCARYSVFLSIVGMGLLGKAVHCNAGRPNLWVLLPCD